MIGVIDSGRGGVLTARILSALLPRADVTLFADRKNAPYGTRSKEEIAKLTEFGIQRLLGCGAERVLLGCCSASSAYCLISSELKKLSIPIIEPTAERALSVSTSGKIGVIATEATVRCGEFERIIKEKRPDFTVRSVASASLVSLVESGASDGNITAAQRCAVEKALTPLFGEEIDTLILGCTHFPYLEKTVGEFFDGVKIVSCAHEGARLASVVCRGIGRGRVRYTE